MRARLLLAVILLGTYAIPAQAALIDRGNGMIYDDVLDITWLKDANYAMTSGFDADGLMTWSDAVAWADSLVFGGFDDWRLPSMDVNGDQLDMNGDVNPFGNGIVDCSTASEMDCRDNELGYMFYYNLGGMFGDDLTGDQGMFTNIQFDHWSGTELLPPGPIPFYILFRFTNGGLFDEDPFFNGGAWAVRSGDVAVIPLPAAAWFMIGGLASLLGFGRR